MRCRRWTCSWASSPRRATSFTKAGEELFLTQSAVSRQIKELEDQLGAELSSGATALALTEAGHQFYAALRRFPRCAPRPTWLRAQAGKALSVTTTHSFASLWLIPRLAGFTRDHPGVDVRITADTKVQDLERDGLDLALRHGPASLAGPNAIILSREGVPGVQPEASEENPLRTPADLRNHVLLQYDDPEVRHPWLHWKTWLEVERIADLRPAGTLSFSGYEQIIPAAVAGHGVALGRSPLVKDLITDGLLVPPFKSQADPARAYFAIVPRNAEGRPEVRAFVDWLESEAAKR